MKKRILAIVLAAAMVLPMTACGQLNGKGTAHVDEDGTRVIKIACWWDKYYDSYDESVFDDPAVLADDDGNIKVADQMRFDVVQKIEEKYGVKVEWVNLTYEGERESINNSILAGAPDCDIYMADVPLAVPAALNGYCLDMKSVLPEDSDIFTNQQIMNYLDLGDGKAYILKPVAAESIVESTYPLAFNVQMLAEAGLEDPRELYERNEWNWDKFIEYCQALTEDTDGDGKVDQYGFAGYEEETAMNLLMSNGAVIAGGKEQTLTDSKVTEALQMISDMYNVYNCCKPYDLSDTSGASRNEYTNGNIGFWPCSAWIQGDNNDYDWDGSLGYTLEFDTAYVPWPVGPSGSKETNPQKLTSGNYYIIPSGVEDPELVYNVLFDLVNYYDYDTTIRDDNEDIHNGSMFWWYCATGKEDEYRLANFDVMYNAGQKEVFDLYLSMGFYLEWKKLISGEMTPSQFQETYKQQVQDGLDNYFK